MSEVVRCLLVFPRFHQKSFWNYRATCELVGAAYPAAPLGMITVAALLPETWEVRLVDCNVEALEDADVEWADVVLTGGMIAQQVSCLELIDQMKAHGKTVVVGGPDATSSPHLYEHADHLVLGEAEITLPRWLAARATGHAVKTYECGEEKANVETSPVPRFDLLKFDRYLHVGIQLSRGCPFLCEFCDIIELFGRVPRLKPPLQMLAELDRLYELGYRGHVDFVDDNFIGNRGEVKKFLVLLRAWLEEHRFPFEFSTEASINLVDDEDLLRLMQEVGFSAVFVGVESPDEETLKSMRKRQNTNRSLSDSLQKIYSYGIFVNTGYIVGFDSERGNVAPGVLHLIETSAVPVNMVGLLFALPNTQLQRRLAKEGRLFDDFQVAPRDAGDQCTGGLNFITKRPRTDILRDFQKIIDESYEPGTYFDRVQRVGSVLDCSQKRLRQPLRNVLRDMKAFARLIWRMGIGKRYRGLFWRTLVKLARRNPRGLRYSIAMMALYLHFGEFRHYLLARLDDAIRAAEDASVAEPARARTTALEASSAPAS
ncbi:MAG: B12-binding domain-containing radical SAM protein [Planctomycetota bacterium]